eukprot:scaffold59585_cov19-Tisochrysis_lutea.AAC.1
MSAVFDGAESEQCLMQLAEELMMLVREPEHSTPGKSTSPHVDHASTAHGFFHLAGVGVFCRRPKLLKGPVSMCQVRPGDSRIRGMGKPGGHPAPEFTFRSKAKKGKGYVAAPAFNVTMGFDPHP